MPPRATWKGFLNLSLVSVAVKAYSASNEGSSVTLNQLHADCNSRIRYDKRCPVHGPVGNDEIVKGYEYAKDQYVIIDLDELDQLRTQEETRSIRIDQFVPVDQLDPLYLNASNYFLVPDGAAGQKPYALIHQAMQQRQVACIAHVVLSKREQLVAVRPLERLLCMSVLRYASQVKSPVAFHDELTDVALSEQELNLALTLIDETTREHLDLNQYQDHYTERLTQLIEAKVQGQQLVAAPAAEPAHVINLMDALKASVQQAQEQRKGVAAASEPARKTARGGQTAADETAATEALKQQLARKTAKAKKKATKATTTRKKKTGS